MTVSREDGTDTAAYERSKIMLGRTPEGKHRLWWRVTIYLGDDREAIDEALKEAIRVDAELRRLG